MDLQPVSRASAVDDCAHQLRRAILTGALPEGRRLPPERELAERLGVNRGTLRAALARLQAAGLLRVRQGSGAVVQDFERTGGPDLLPGLAELAREEGALPALCAELLRIRRHLAGAVLERIAELRPDPAPVVAAVDGFARALAAGDPTGLADADLAVLDALIGITGSPVLRLSLNPVRGVLATLPSLQAAVLARPAENLAGWRLLCAWLVDPDPAGVDAIRALLATRDAATLAALGAP